MFCQKCGTEISENTIACSNCGCPTQAATKPNVATRKPVSKKAIVLSAIGAFVLILIVFVAAVLIRTDIKLNDLTSTPNRINALIQFGLPRNFGKDKWTYEDCITLEGINLDYFSIYFDEGKYSIFEYDYTDQEKLAELLVDECSFERSNNAFYYFSYKNLDITSDSECTWVSIEVPK